MREGATAQLERGRRPTLLGLNDDLAILVADVHPKEATVAMVDLNGRLLARTVVKLLGTPEASITRIADGMKRLVKQCPQKTLEGVGLALPGRVEPSSRRLIFAPNLKWCDVDVCATLGRQMGLPVELENAANASLLAEVWLGNLNGVRDAVLVTVSEGIGTGILANGHIVAGSNGMAGEFGHAPIDESGPLCACGARGCWEVFASCTAAIRYYHEFAKSKEQITFHELLLRAERGNVAAARAIDRQASYVGRGLRTVIAGVSPSVIIFAGDITSSWSRYETRINAELRSRSLGSLPLPRLVVTDEGESTRLRGAAAIVLQRHSGYHRHSQTAFKRVR